jgi:hypothetical protein
LKRDRHVIDSLARLDHAFSDLLPTPPRVGGRAP